MSKLGKFLGRNKLDFEHGEIRFNRVILEVDDLPPQCATSVYMDWDTEYSPDIYFADNGEVYVLVYTGTRTPYKGLHMTTAHVLYSIQALYSLIDVEDADETLEDHLDAIAEKTGWAVVNLKATLNRSEEDFIEYETY